MDALFPYQTRGADWLSSRSFAILGDQPRVGKTAQVVRACDQVARKVSITCPAIAIDVWHTAIERWGAGFFQYTVQSYDIAARRGLPDGCDTYVFDEAHRLANIAAGRTKTLLGMASPARAAARVWAVSGSIAPKHYGNLYPWLRFAGLVDGGYHAFLDRFTNWQMNDYGSPKVWGNKASALPELQAILAPVFLRRTRAEVFPEQPRTIWGDIPLHAKNVGNIDNHLANSLLIDDTLPDEDEHTATLRRLVGETKAGPLAEYLAGELAEHDDKIAVYAWHSSVMDLLEAGLSEFGVARIDGSTPARKRTAAVTAHRTDPTKRVLLGQVIAAGEAIDLSHANDLVLAEMSWTNGQNEQVTSRLGGPGQTQASRIRTATLRGTIDEGVHRVLTRDLRALEQLYGGAS